MNQTDGLPVVAKVEVRVRFVRVEEQVVRAVRIARRSRLVETAVLHNVHDRTEAVARSRKENRACGFEMLPLGKRKCLVVGIRLYAIRTCKTALEGYTFGASPGVGQQDKTVDVLCAIGIEVDTGYTLFYRLRWCEY